MRSQQANAGVNGETETMSEFYKYICPACGKRAAVFIPHDGDGTGFFFKRHKDPDGKRCKGSHLEAQRWHRADEAAIRQGSIDE